MKVVILHQHFKIPASGGALRSWYLAKALAENGVHVVVVTAQNQRRYSRLELEGIEIHYLPVAYDNKFGFTARGFAFLRFAWQSIHLLTKLQDVNLIYAISVPLTTGIAALRLKKRKSIPYIFEVGDLWPDAPVELGFVNNYFLRQYLYALEKKIYRHAESVVALSPAIQSAIEAKVPDKKTYMIPNMSDCDFYKPEVKDSALAKKFGVTGKFVVSYIGSLGFANGLDYLIECANTCRKENLPVHFIICGEGAVKERLQRHADHLGLKNLSMIGFQNREGVRDLMNVTDAAFVCYKNVPILETGSPNKFFDGLAAGKLIVVNFGGWIRKEIEASQCGFWADPRQPLDFTTKIRTFINDPEKLSRFQKASRELAERKFSRQTLGQQFTDIIRRTAP